MTPSKQGFAVVFNTQGAVAGASRQSFALMNMGMQAARLRADRELQTQKMAMESIVKDRNIDARGRADFDQVLYGEMSRLEDLSKNGELNIAEVSRTATRLNSLAETINGGYKLGDDLVKESDKRGYIPERVQEFNALALSRINLDPESKAKAYARINEVGAYTQMPFGSYLINESKAAEEFVKGYGVSIEDLRRGDYIAQTEVARQVFERDPKGGFRAKRADKGLVVDEVFNEAIKNPLMSRLADDAVTYEAYSRVVDKFTSQNRELPADWEDVQKIGLYGYADDNPASNMFYKEILDERNSMTQQEVYRSKNLRIGELLDNAAAGKYNLSTVPEGHRVQSFKYTNGGIMFGKDGQESVVSFRTNLVGNLQYMSVPKDVRKRPIPVKMGGEQYYLLPSEWAVSDKEQVKLRGGVMIKADGQNAGSLATLIAQINSDNINAASIQNALAPVAADAPEGAARDIKVVEIDPDTEFDAGEFAAIQILDGIGVDSRLMKTGSTVGALRGHYRNALNSIPGVKSASQSSPAAQVPSFNVDNVDIE
jgi:hypothetical protein